MRLVLWAILAWWGLAVLFSLAIVVIGLVEWAQRRLDPHKNDLWTEFDDGEYETWRHCEWFVNADAGEQQDHLIGHHGRDLFSDGLWPSSSHNQSHRLVTGWSTDWNRLGAS